MGKRSNEIQYDLERQRNALEARIQRLNRRIRDDVQAIGDEAKYDVDHWIGKESAMAERPKTLLASAAGAGLALGLVTDGMGMPRPSLRRNGHGPDESKGQSEAEKKSKLRALTGVATGAAAGSVQGQVSSFLGEIWDSFKSGWSSSGGHEERRLPPDIRSSRSNGSSIPGGSSAGHGTRYLRRDELSPDAVDADVALKPGEKSPREILHDARAEDYAPRENMPGYAGVQGEGLLLPETPGVQAPYEEEHHSERHTGQ
jgi:hypothetical protein